MFEWFDTVRICVAHDLDGQRIDYYPASLEQLKRCVNLRGIARLSEDTESVI